MKIVKVIPAVLYDDMRIGIKFFVEGLGFKITYQDDSLCIVARDETVLQIGKAGEGEGIERPQIRLETDDIEAYYNEIKNRDPKLLHPNLKVIKNQPWGLKEFAMLDETTVCVVVQQSIL